MKKDKVKVLDEVLSPERIESFLSLQAPEGCDADYHCLEKAYRGMPPQYFDMFLELFIKQGRNINAQSKIGKTLLQSISSHRQSKEYIDLLNKAGAA